MPTLSQYVLSVDAVERISSVRKKIIRFSFLICRLLTIYELFQEPVCSHLTLHTHRNRIRVFLARRPYGFYRLTRLNYVFHATMYLLETLLFYRAEDLVDDGSYRFSGDGYAVLHTSATTYNKYLFSVSLTFKTFDERSLLFLVEGSQPVSRKISLYPNAVQFDPCRFLRRINTLKYDCKTAKSCSELATLDTPCSKYQRPAGTIRELGQN